MEPDDLSGSDDRVRVEARWLGAGECRGVALLVHHLAQRPGQAMALEVHCAVDAGQDFLAYLVPFRRLAGPEQRRCPSALRLEPVVEAVTGFGEIPVGPAASHVVGKDEHDL